MHHRSSVEARHRLALLPFALASLVAFAGCDSRFPVCKTDADCKTKSEGAASAAPNGERGKVCFDLRCVECHYDADCREGEVCSTATRECKKLDGTTPAASAAPGEPGSGVPAGAPRDPAAWEACVKKCADKDCIAKCDAQYE